MNHIALIIDESGSMQVRKNETVNVVQTLIKEIKEKSNKYNQATSLSIYKFANRVKRQTFVETDLNRVKFEYNPGGMTALWDAVHNCIQDFSNLGQEDSYVLIVVTDGENNASQININTLKEEMKQVQLTDRWTITFQVPPGSKNHILSLGIPSDNVIEWSNIGEVEERTSGGIEKYYSARSSGKRSVSNFFTDLSNVTQVELKKLIDLSSRFKTLTASKEEIIQPFVEEKTRQPYIKGDAFYQLMKKEKVQDHKQIVIMDKVSKKMYGGEQARDLLGLPHYGEVKVEPLNHGNYEIFVQSTSVNRKIPRGTKVLVRK